MTLFIAIIVVTDSAYIHIREYDHSENINPSYHSSYPGSYGEETLLAHKRQDFRSSSGGEPVRGIVSWYWPVKHHPAETRA